MLTCKDISNLASDHIDNNLSPYMRMKLKMHLLMCHKCRNFVDQLSITVNTLKQLKSPQPEEDFVKQQVDTLVEIANQLQTKDSNNHGK